MLKFQETILLWVENTINYCAYFQFIDAAAYSYAHLAHETIIFTSTSSEKKDAMQDDAVHVNNNSLITIFEDTIREPKFKCRQIRLTPLW